MTWWAWVLVWVVLVLAAGAFLYLVARRLFRQGAALARELAAAADLLSEVTRALEDRAEDAPAPATPAPGRPRSSTRATPGRPRRPAPRQDVR